MTRVLTAAAATITLIAVVGAIIIASGGNRPTAQRLETTPTRLISLEEFCKPFGPPQATPGYRVDKVARTIGQTPNCRNGRPIRRSR